MLNTRSVLDSDISLKTIFSPFVPLGFLISGCQLNNSLIILLEETTSFSKSLTFATNSSILSKTIKDELLLVTGTEHQSTPYGQFRINTCSTEYFYFNTYCLLSKLLSSTLLIADKSQSSVRDFSSKSFRFHPYFLTI